MWKTALAPVQGTGLAASLLIMAAGVVVVAFAVACYIISVFPTNPTDDLVVALHERGIRLGTAKVFTGRGVRDSGGVVRRRDWHRNHRMHLWIRSGNRHVSPENPREDIRLAGKWESGLKVSGSLNVPK
ncbi:MAG: hypothetical protein ACLVD8_10860 [Enterocloster sp.]|uniref:hypothetical protein n=1 Tax=Enterocloster sp. TaxID=2719315 RepID=UPI00399A7BFB